MASLQRRVVLGGVLWAILAIFIGGFAILSVFDQIANRRFNALLEERHTQIVVALANVQSPTLIEGILTDPAYDRPYSGRYWQIDGIDGQLHVSRSLFDTQFEIPSAAPASAHLWNQDGPTGPIRGIREMITLDDGSKWVVSVARSVSALEAEKAEMQRYVAIAFSLVGLLGVAGAGILTTVLVKPLRRLRDDVVRRWETGDALDVDRYPSEVVPLVSDINELMRRNREVIDQGRRQAADLAHALKTPSSALRNELESIGGHMNGETAPAFDALDRIDAQITKSLARMRAAGASHLADLRTDLAHSISRLERLFRSLPNADGKDFVVRSEPATVAADAQDVEEMIGNLLENAFKWSSSRIAVGATTADGIALVRIEDDGPGIEDGMRNTVLEPGARLDTSVPGSGLGLAIATDLARAYGGTLDLSESEELGGLKVELRLPLASLGLSNVTTIATDHTKPI